MSQHTHGPVKENVESHPVKLAITLAVGAGILIVGIMLLANFAVGTHNVGSESGSAMSSEETAKRIAPVARLVVDPSQAPAPSAAPASANSAKAAPVVAVAIPAAAAPAAAKVDGKETFMQACNACHGLGVAGAPKLGDKTAWTARIAQGSAALYDHAIKGYQGKAGVMPAKGGNATLGDANVKAAVDYMVSQAK